MSNLVNVPAVLLSSLKITAVEGVRAAKRERKSGEHYAAVVAANNTTADTLTEHAKMLAAMAVGCETDAPLTDAAKPGETYRPATVFGVAVKTARAGLKSVLDKSQAAETEPGVIRLSLSGEGGGTVTLREGDEHYAAALKMIAAGLV